MSARTPLAQTARFNAWFDTALGGRPFYAGEYSDDQLRAVAFAAFEEGLRAARVDPSPLAQAVALIESRFDYYETVHDAQCGCWQRGHHENLKYCTCGLGKAWAALRAALLVPTQPTENKDD